MEEKPGARENLLDNFLKKISVCLFLYSEPISISKLRIISELEEIRQSDLEKMFSLLNDKLSDLGLSLLRDSNPMFEQQELMIVAKDNWGIIARNIKRDELSGELTPAALQVMTIAAYLDGATKEEISLIRGTQSSQSLRTLLARGLLQAEAGKYFLSLDALREIGISKISELPEFERIQKNFREKLEEVQQG